MNRIVIRLAAAAVLGLAAVPGARAADATLGYAFVGGSGENESVTYAGTLPRGQALDPATITGSGENISVELPRAVLPSATQYQALIEGTGDNQSVRYVPVTPRG